MTIVAMSTRSATTPRALPTATGTFAVEFGGVEFPDGMAGVKLPDGVAGIALPQDDGALLLLLARLEKIVSKPAVHPPMGALFWAFHCAIRDGDKYSVAAALKFCTQVRLLRSRTSISVSQPHAGGAANQLFQPPTRISWLPTTWQVSPDLEEFVKEGISSKWNHRKAGRVSTSIPVE